MSKRGVGEGQTLVLSKRSRLEEEEEASSADQRTSSLQAPNLILEGHSAAVYTTGTKNALLGQ